MVEIMINEIQGAGNDEMLRLVEFFASVVILGQPYKQMWNRNVLERLVERVDSMSQHNKLQ